MDDSQLIHVVITFAVVGILVPATLWYLAIRLGKPQLKMWGAVIGVTYTLLFAVNAAHEWLDWFPNVYETYLAGPNQRTRGTSAVSDASYRVNEAGSRHELVLTPVANYDEPAMGPVTIVFEVHSPSGRVVAKGQQTLAPAKNHWTPIRANKAATWTPLKTEFTSPEDGDHKLIVEIPRPVRKVRVEITERKN